MAALGLLDSGTLLLDMTEEIGTGEGDNDTAAIGMPNQKCLAFLAVLRVNEQEKDLGRLGK